MNGIRRVILVVTFILLFSVTTYAKSNDFIVNKVYFLNQHHLTGKQVGNCLFLFEDVVIEDEYLGNLFLVNCNATIKGGIAGDVYTLNSSVFIDERSNIDGDIISFYSVVQKHIGSYMTGEIKALFKSLEIFSKDTVTDNLFIYSDTLPKIITILAMGILQTFVALVFLSSKKSFYEQGCIALEKEFLPVLKNGLRSYFILGALILIFLISIIGAPFSLVLILLAFLLSLLGQIMIAIYIGFFINKKVKLNMHTVTMFFVGNFLIEFLKFIPFTGNFFVLFILPILAIGILVQTFSNYFLRKKFFEVSFDTEIQKKHFSKSSTYAILTKDL